VVGVQFGWGQARRPAVLQPPALLTKPPPPQTAYKPVGGGRRERVGDGGVGHEVARQLAHLLREEGAPERRGVQDAVAVKLGARPGDLETGAAERSRLSTRPLSLAHPAHSARAATTNHRGSHTQPHSAALSRTQQQPPDSPPPDTTA
jgi:hypothetical protein